MARGFAPQIQGPEFHRRLSGGDLIRAVSEHDAGQIFEILAGLAGDYPFSFGTPWKFERVIAECRDGGFVDIDSQGLITAFLFFRDLGEAWEISFIAARYEARAKGHGGEFLRQVVAMTPPGKNVWLEVHERNLPARRLYERVGFKVVGTRANYYPDGASAVLYNYG